MEQSILTTLGIIFKKITGVKDISALRKEIHKQWGMLRYHETYTADDIVQVMIDLGMTQGSTICIHAAMKEFYNYRGTAEELIDKITEVIGPEGTLMMPAFPSPKDFKDPTYTFNPSQARTFAGHLAETFRKMQGVRRSINVQHSVCARGKYAAWLTADHHRGENCWDECSPWYRLIQLDGLVFSLGLSDTYIGTFDHCVEGLLYREHPYWAQFLTKRRTFRYLDEQGNIQTYTNLTGDVECRTRESRLTKHFSAEYFKKKKLSNLLIKAFAAKPCFEKMLDLGRHGITMYYVPSPKKHQF